MSTVFAKIIRREIPAKIVFESNTVLAFEDLMPQAPHHVLIIPKHEIATVNDLTPETAHYLGDMYLAAKEIAKARGLSEGGYRLVMNCNAGAGQTVFHIHLHFLAGRPFSWPPG
jgi:histidine triad (HIT) family protein